MTTDKQHLQPPQLISKHTLPPADMEPCNQRIIIRLMNQWRKRVGDGSVRTDEEHKDSKPWLRTGSLYTCILPAATLHEQAAHHNQIANRTEFNKWCHMK